MAEIIYFGTNGCSGHYPIGIDKTLNWDEYGMWCECDNDAFCDFVRMPKGSIKKLIGRELSWSDEPVKLKEE